MRFTEQIYFIWLGSNEIPGKFSAFIIWMEKTLSWMGIAAEKETILKIPA